MDKSLLHGPPTRLLLVEDNQGDALLVMEMLADAQADGFSVTHVVRCSEAVQHAHAGEIDIILLDLSLPDAQGLDGLRRLRAAAPNVPTVIMSGNTDEATAIAGVRAGAQDYLIKGQVSSDLVARSIRYAIERQRVEAQLAQVQAAELALREANRRMEEFLSIAGHEMRTPLTSVLGYVELAAKWADEPVLPASRVEQIRRLLLRTESQALRLNRLVTDLLDASRVQTNRLELRQAHCDLAAIVEEAIHEQQQMAPARTITLQRVANLTLPIFADADRLAQVLTNYLSNALRYSSADQPVAIGLEVDSGSAPAVARVWIQDGGPGVPVEEQDRIWERFYRVAETAHRDGSSVGLGLGLYISRNIIERHGGQVGVESAAGAGARFWFMLPLATAESAPVLPDH